MAINTRNQRYAGQVYDQVESVSATQREKYVGLAHKLPVLIRTAGLAQALAFVAASKEGAHQLLLNHLSKVVGAETSATLLERSRTDELARYMRLTQEVLTALLWYKRFAQASSRGPAKPPPQATLEGNEADRGDKA